MRVQVNTDGNVTGPERLVAQVTADVEAALGRFSDGITRIEVHLSDESAGRSTGADKRCMLEARPAGRSPVAVTSHGQSIGEAVDGAIGKLTPLLDTEFGRRNHRKGTATIRNGPSSEGTVTPSTGLVGTDSEAEAGPS